eukprot:TRINITY_DN3398_c0_g2_i1.p1 TRINITY_DN3398_c0_g2~~TRINITY_DN3398_c0_g2_i1.p1  ORF type:complete len:559 (-),score=89.84 TRINITY_DN3398_c0_g2_i1:12-1688(-)
MCRNRRDALLLAAIGLILLPSAHGRWNRCRLDRVLDTDRLPGLENFWDTFVRNESKLTVDTGADMSTARFFARWASILTKSDDLIVEIVNDCAFGLLTVLLHAIPVVEYSRGREEAWRMLQLAQAIASELQQADDASALRLEATEAGWDVESILDTLQSYGSFLSPPGMVASSPIPGSDCEGMRFYVYSSPPTELGQPLQRILRESQDSYLEALLQAPLQCLFGMYGTELLYHRLFSSSTCRTEVPEEADFFFVPSYFKCIEVLNYADHFNEGRKGEEEASVLFDQTLKHVKSSPWFARHDGADHVFLFSWGRFPCRLPAWRERLRAAVNLQVEDHCEDLNSEGPQSTFSRWKDIIIPGHIDRWRALELRRQNRPFEKRDVLLAFHGRHGGNADSYANVSVRTAILEMEGLPGASVGGFVEDYHDLLGSSIYCLAPRGITPWTIHLYVAMLAGCIPVILSDDFELPFQDVLDWQSFSIRWPESQAGRPLYDYLTSIPVDVAKKMKRQVDAQACWVDYYSDSEGCSPYVAVLRSLRKRQERLPRYVGRWWGPGDPVLPS